VTLKIRGVRQTVLADLPRLFNLDGGAVHEGDALGRCGKLWPSVERIGALAGFDPR